MVIMEIIVLSNACRWLDCLHPTRLHSAESTTCFCADCTPTTPVINIPPTSPYLYPRPQKEMIACYILFTRLIAVA